MSDKNKQLEDTVKQMQEDQDKKRTDLFEKENVNQRPK